MDQFLSELRWEKRRLAELRRELTVIRYELKFRRLMRALKAGFNPDQPRDELGRWTDDGVEEPDVVGGINDPRVISDADLDPIIPGAQYAANGHHYVARAIFNDSKYSLSAEALEVFKKETTGQLQDPTSNRFDDQHRQYNKAVREAFEDYLQQKRIRPDRMTSDEAKEFSIKSSGHPIRGFANSIEESL